MVAALGRLSLQVPALSPCPDFPGQQPTSYKRDINLVLHNLFLAMLFYQSHSNPNGSRGISLMGKSRSWPLYISFFHFSAAMNLSRHCHIFLTMICDFVTG